jgi:hypothetical protein
VRQKQIVTREGESARKSELDYALAGALTHATAEQDASDQVVSWQAAALYHAACAGFWLLAARAIVPRGSWVEWLELTFCSRAKVSVQHAYRYIKVAADNYAVLERHFACVRQTEVDFEVVKKFLHDSIRKHCFSYVPDKPQIEHPCDVKFPRLVSFLNIANEFAKIKQRHLDGLLEIDFIQVREDCRELYRHLQWLYGDRSGNPWD